ncbi:MAG: hypothetical protein LBK47_07820 [Prevotellaceae bacterium]|nr:hypothetical protein [Prevotellaceae bacterium]
MAVAVVRGDKNRLYVHEVTIKEKLFLDSSNPVQQNLQANLKRDMGNPLNGSSNQGDVVKILQNFRFKTTLAVLF